MDNVFQEAVTRIVDLPREQQRKFGEMLLVSEALQTASMPVIEFNDEESAMIDEAVISADAGRFADPAKVEAFFSRHRA